MMEEGNEYLKLSVEEQCVHKLWKARVHGYEEASKLFHRLDDEKSPEFSKYLGLVKKFVIDSNAAAQEKGLEAVLAFVENSAVAGKTVGEVMNGVVSKCIAAPKAKTKELAVQVTLMYIEIEKMDAVQEELLKGMEHKNPKIVAACVQATTLALKEFGTKVINIKPLLKKAPVLLEDRDKAVRDEGKALVVEMYRWIGAALQPQLKDLKPLHISELEGEFEKVRGERAIPTRYIRSQQQKQQQLAAVGSGDAENNEGNDPCNVPEEIDPYDLMDPVDILSKLSKDFYEKVEAKKWQERKQAVDELEQLLQAPKLESGDYGDLVRALKKIITKDTNVVVVAVAAKCLGSLANGLKKRFQPYASACVPAILEKFREKKQNVVSALKDAIDAIFVSTTIEAIQEDALAALENKNPSVKAETAAFLARCFSKCTPTHLSKKLLKAYSASLLKLLNDPDPIVRDNAAEALGTAMKVVGEKAITPFMADIEPIKKTKIKECCDKAVIVAKVSLPKGNERPSTAPASLSRPDVESVSSGPSTTKANKRPASSVTGVKKTVPKKTTNSSGNVAAKSDKTEKEMSIEEVDEKAAEIFPDDLLSGLSDANWKTRLCSVEQFIEVVGSMSPSEVPSQVLIKVLNKKPGLKDTNFQVMKARLEALKLIAEKSILSSTSIEACVVDVAEKLGDAKNGALAGEVLTALAEASRLELVGPLVLDFAFSQKSPKVQQESLNWLSNALREFGFVIQPKSIIENVRKAILATAPPVKSSGIQFVGTLYLYMGAQLLNLFENEKPTLKQLIQAEFDKHVGESPPIPIRGSKKNTEDQGEKEEKSGEQANFNWQELTPCVDINSQITESLLTELRDKNWKVRIEALQKLENILKENKHISSNLGELPEVLAQRLLDSNSNIAKTAIAFCQVLGVAMASQCKIHIPTVFPSLLQCLGDNKQWIRSAAIACINAWGENCGFKEFFKNEMVADALKSDSPNLRAELWSWLSTKLPDLQPKSIPKEELTICLPYLYTNVEDRNADVRKNAVECILPFMLHLNYTTMAKATDKVKPGSKSAIMSMLEKVRGSVPSKQLSAPSKTSNEEENKTMKTNKVASTANKGAAKGKPVAKPGTRKKDEETDTSPVLQYNNMKHQRTIDEQKLKVLKWNFTTPREEFVELLKDQMTAAGVNKNLLANMFHSDFRYHLKAIDTLNEDLPTNGTATVANLDLILKWMTLRFFDTNPSVLIKGLEYLQMVFNMLIDEEYSMYENEAASFIPYLILKIGDPKDAVRNSVRTLFRQMERIYPLTKLFGYIMEGLKSKNARQRTECLDLLGFLIESYGVLVCNPSPAAALKEIAKQISDRDNSVRNAALNCVVQAYFLEGEKVYKMVGQVSEKDLCLLEERIKRAAKNRPPKSVVSSTKPMQQPQTQQIEPVVAPKGEDISPEETSDHEDVEPPPVMRNLTPKPRPVSGPFGLDTKLLEQIEGESIGLNPRKLENFDLTEIWEPPLNIPKSAFCGLGTKPDNALPTALIAARPRKLDDCSTTSQVVDYGIANIASADVQLAWEANVQMEQLIVSDKANVLIGKEDSLIKSCCIQLKLLHANFDQGNIHNLGKGYRTLLLLIIEFFDQKVLCSNVSEDSLVELGENLLTMLVSGRVENLEEGHIYIRILNTLMLRIIEFANHTNVTCAFLQILHTFCGSNSLPPRYGELTLKCLWRLVKFLPDWEADLDITMVLMKIHNFLKDFPPSTWKKRDSDTPIRTVKTILHTITKMVGGEKILQYANHIDNLEDSELLPYLHKLSKKIKTDETKKTLNKRTPHKLSKITHEQLSEIFKKIGAREQTKEGLELLYDFREQHPEADIEPFLKKSSQFFQDYIEKNLRLIHAERKKGFDDRGSNFKSLSTTTSMSSLGMHESGGPGTPFSDTGDPTILPHSINIDHGNIRSHMNDGESDQGGKGPQYYLERLRALQAQAGLNPSSVPLDSVRKQNDLGQENTLTNDRNLNKQQLHNDLVELHSHSHSTSSNAGENCAAADIEDIRKRLEMFKNAKR